MNHKWNYQPITPEQAETSQTLAQELGISPILGQLLVQRGITKAGDAKKFFRPQLPDLHDPFLMKDMDIAVERLNKAMGKKERILIYGDYDVDGTTAVALVYKFIQQFYSNIDYYIPDRYNEGYGISKKGVDYASETGVGLIIVLDCGIKAVEEITYAKEKGIDFIICDHHVPDDILPPAVAILNAKRLDNTYPYTHLSGCGVGFKFMQAFAINNGIEFHHLHPEAEIVFVNSSSNAGNKITDVHEGLYGETDLTFTDELPLDEIDVLFFCTAHGDTRKFMESHNVPEDLKIIDLSMDYRIKSDDHDFIYGLPELNRRATCTAKHVANPGCFATCIQLGLLPLAKHLMLNGDIMVNAITGSTGAGVKPGATSHFSWRNNNLSVYKAFEHQHVPEIKQSLKQLQNSFDSDIDFIPYRGDFPRGIFTTIVIKTKVALEEIVRMYEEYYAKDSFTHIVGKNIDLKQVVNTNKCLIHLEKHGDKLLIISCIDNLLKGASGQAVHNMNLMFNLEETVGLRLKPSAF